MQEIKRRHVCLNYRTFQGGCSADLCVQMKNLNRNLIEKVGQMSDMMDKQVSFMMGVCLSGLLT